MILGKSQTISVFSMVALLLLTAPSMISAQHASETRQLFSWDFKQAGNIVRGAVKTEQEVSLGNVFTLYCKIKAGKQRTAHRVIIAKDALQGAGHFQFRLDKGTGALSLFAPGLSAALSSGITVDDGRWHEVAVSYAQGWVKFYKDGDLVKAIPVKGAIAETPATLSVGALADGSNTFSGTIADVKVYRSVLNPVKIFHQYTKKIACFDFNEGMGVTTLADEGNASYGMLNGPANTYNNFGKASTGWLKATQWTIDKKFGHVLDFSASGASVVVDSCTIPASGSLTIAIWVKASATATGQTVLLSAGPYGEKDNGFALQLTPTNELVLQAAFLKGNTASGIKITGNQWQHILLSYSAGALQFYKNGKLVKTNQVTGSFPAISGPLYIGSNPALQSSFGGQLARLKIFASAFSALRVNDIYNELEAAGWKMNEAQGNLLRDMNEEKNNASFQQAGWVPGTGSSFSQVLQLNHNSIVQTKATELHPSNRFTMAAWIRLPADRSRTRVIVSKGRAGAAGYFAWQVQKATGIMEFHAQELMGDLSSGFTIDDNRWHHVMISYGNGEMKFYKDRQLIKTSQVSGSIKNARAALVIGAAAPGQPSMEAALSELKIYQAVKRAEEATAVVPNVGTRLNLKRGIVFDRIQNQQFPVKEEWQIGANDVAVAKAMGFDHIKVLLTADQYILDSGLNAANMYYVDKMVNTALASGLPCVIDLHPEGAFKNRYLGTDTGFVDMLGFYRAFAKYIVDRWTPDQVAFQLMTEPFANKAGPKKGDWNDLTEKMVAATRSTMPDHTLILSGDRAGNIYAMTSMVPLQDDNIYYSFTTYEPYRFGFNTQFGAWRGAGPYWKDISYMPWPSSPEIVSARMEEMLNTVKAEDRSKAKEDLLKYGEGYFNRQWLFRRAKNVGEWNESYGGNLQVIVAEFGAIDHVKARAGGASKGIYEQERINYIRDLRQSFESVGMGWEYWSFNEYFTILDPAVRKSYGPSSMEIADRKMLSALGL